MNKILLDTNAYSALRRGDKDILSWLSQADLVFMSVVVLGELHAGFRGGKKRKENVATIDRFISRPTVRVASVNKETSRIFGKLKHDLRLKGTPLPTNDIWIASQCMEKGAVLVSYDSHFDQIPGLQIWDF